MIKINKVKRIKDLPSSSILEEVRIYYAPSNNLLKTDDEGKRQEVLLFCKKIGNRLFLTDEKGNILKEKKFRNVEWITFISRS